VDADHDDRRPVRQVVALGQRLRADGQARAGVGQTVARYRQRDGLAFQNERRRFQKEMIRAEAMRKEFRKWLIQGKKLCLARKLL